MSRLDRPANREELVDIASGNKQIKLQEQVRVLAPTSKVRTRDQGSGQEPGACGGKGKNISLSPIGSTRSLPTIAMRQTQ
jgi:hypothetical protein